MKVTLMTPFMNKPAKLSDIIDAIEIMADETSSYLNRKTGEVVMVTDEEMRAAEEDEPLEEYPEWQRESIEIAGKILESEDYVSLPDKFDVHEYSIMEDFCMSIDDEKMRNVVYSSIKGSGAFRRFKDNIHKYDIADEWYEYKSEALKQKAIDWCKENSVEYVQ
jgi:hypothetical protein